MKFKKQFAAVVAGALTVASLAGCAAGQSPVSESPASTQAQATPAAVSAEPVVAQQESSAPKYVFLFIGDGMSYVQFQTASDYLGAVSDPDAEILQGGEALSFMSFPVAGSATTYDSTSFCPDSASTATSIASGHKTHSGMLNMDETATVKYETIAEKLKNQLGYKVGVISTVNLNHATPAAFYAHQASRNDYYEIGEELVASGFDYFAGGALKSANGGATGRDVYTLAREAGYKVVFDQSAAEKLTDADGKAIVITDTLADSFSMSYENDRADGEWALADYVKKGIEVLDNDKGFFMMVEGGKIDWACHANDAGSTIADTVALSNAVGEAVAFYNQHPDETLILVTGDHETGGLTIGYAGTNYDTYLNNLANQKMSYAKFDSEYVKGYKENKTSFEDVLADIKANFGLIAPNDPAATEGSTLVLTEYELAQLEEAYNKSMAGEEAETDMTQAEYVMYGSYEPLTVTVTHILNNKSGISFSSYSHTGLPVPVFAMGVGEDQFKGYYDNTGIYERTASILEIS